MPDHSKRLRLATVLLAVVLMAGCATGKDPRDPFEGFNRGVYTFNDELDKAILRPTAEAYRVILPQFVRSSVSNFFSNINDIVVALNNLLQGKFTAAYSDLGRVAINSTIGVLGLFDVASEAGIEKHDEDFGQTLGRWGVAEGPYIMLPFFGPSTGRDTVGRVGDYFSDPVSYVDPTRNRNQLWGTRVVSRRAELLDASTVLQTAALDPYEFVRDAYLQRRRSLIHDGNPPRDREFLDPPPKASSLPQSSPFPTSAETSYGSVWVSSQPLAPVHSAFTEPAPAPARKSSAAASTRGTVVAMRSDGSAVVTGEPLNANPLEPLAPGTEKAADYEPPRLTQFWKALQITR